MISCPNVSLYGIRFLVQSVSIHYVIITEFAPRPNTATFGIWEFSQIMFADSTQASLGKLGGSQLITNNGANFLIALLRD